MKRILVLGGAGFLGSRIVEVCAGNGHEVYVVDGLLANTSGRSENLPPTLPTARFCRSRVEETENLDALLQNADVIVDAMGWTRHLMALEDPIYDLTLNVASHLAWLARTPPGKLVIYLGSRSQYGSPHVAEIVEDTPLMPVDIQGIHKLTGELHVRFYSRLRGFSAVSLRLPNCIGRNQISTGEDIGLVGGFIRRLLSGQEVELYGEGRMRPVAYADDVAGVIEALTSRDCTGFEAYNMFCHHVRIEDLLRKLRSKIGRGSYSIRLAPAQVAAIDVGGAHVSHRKLEELLGGPTLTDLDAMLDATVNYFRGVWQ